jgi:hypothetical protein
MLKSWTVCGSVSLAMALPAPTDLAAQPDWQQGASATVVLRDGTRHQGHSPIYRLDRGQVIMRISAEEEPRVPAEQVAYIDFTGGQPKVQEQRGAPHLLVMRDGSAVPGRIVELGHGDPEDRTSPYLVIFETQQGEERRLNVNQVAQVYFGDPQQVVGTTAVEAPAAPGTFTVAANRQWTSTRLVVRQGETIRFDASGEIQLSQDEKDRAQPDGSFDQRRAPGAPLPNVLAGALIGRIGTGQPFAIGGQDAVQMPGSGELFLGINDDHVADNQGQFTVRVEREASQRRR